MSSPAQTNDEDDEGPPENPELCGKLMKADDSDGWVDWEEDFEQWANTSLSCYVTAMDLLVAWIAELENLVDRIQATRYNTNRNVQGRQRRWKIVSND